MSASQIYRLGFIGAGKLAGSVIRGLMRAKFCPPGEIIASEPNEQTRTALQKESEVSVTAENAEIAEKAEVIFIGVKPAMVLSVLQDLSDNLQHKLLISLAGGVRISSMEKTGSARFMRALTNTPSAICRAATAIARGSRAANEDVDLAKRIFGAIGVVVEVEEAQIDAVTALSGSGPAFIYTVIEALAKGGTKMGLSDDVALELAAQTTLGAAALMQESKMSPEDLRKMVATPGGTTAAGLAIMEKLGTSESLIAAVEAATKRGQEMADENK
ncbi:MAG TPA: pyrroline-5-carboxylate reductase [Chthoniobacterales bacterium]|nr:pyrroline-5-carboxylate reductase [Chthoniobacterales bacterium]